MTERTVRRLFVGNISEQLAGSCDDLVRRIVKFGEIKSEFELHFNEVKQNGFGYLDISINDKEYTKLKGSLNGVNFKGRKLVIDLAKDDHKKVWEQHHNDRRLEKQKNSKILKQQWEFFKKIDNINQSFRDRQLLIKGRMRQKPRKSIKNMTLRVSFNGVNKLIKCYKTKLWGYEKNKKLRDLVYKFQNGVWKDGNDHIVERLSSIQLRQGDNHLKIERVGARNDDELIKSAVDEDEQQEELEKNNKVLANLLGQFDFNKAIDYKEEVDEDFADSDYEYESALRHGDDGDDSSKPLDLSQIEYVKEGEFEKNPQGTSHVVSFEDEEEEDDDDEDDDIYDKANMGFVKPQPKDEKANQVIDNQKDSPMDVDSSDEDTEFLPTFGQSTGTTVDESQVNSVEGTVSNTEQLRDLFNPNNEETFKLIEEEDEDIDKSKTIVQTDIKLPEFQIQPIISKSKDKKSLFFPHFDSPFLVAQTQINKLNSNVDFGNWSEEFWEKRIQWTQDLKRRRRDVMRQLRKKNAKNSRVFV